MVTSNIHTRTCAFGTTRMLLFSVRYAHSYDDLRTYSVHVGATLLLNWFLVRSDVVSGALRAPVRTRTYTYVRMYVRVRARV